MSNNENKKDLLKKINDIDSKIENEKSYKSYGNRGTCYYRTI